MFNSKITVFEKSSKKIAGIFLPNTQDGHFIMALPAGEYMIEIEGEQMRKFESSIIIPDRDQFKPTITKNYKISPAEKL
ncbi:MAG: hypothetical protein V2A54_04090, partial [Bacteroidota bacterium]